MTRAWPMRGRRESRTTDFEQGDDAASLVLYPYAMVL